MAEILVQVVPRYSETSGDLAAAFIGPEAFKHRIDEVGESLASIANSLRLQLEQRLSKGDGANAGWCLESVELKFSMDLEAEAGVIISRAKASAGFEVTLGWKAG